MLRVALSLLLFPTLPLHAAESVATRIETEYRAKRQSALAAQWMEVKLPFETPAAFLARLLDTARQGDSRATAALGWEFHNKGDDLRARVWLGKSAERGNRFAAYLLGLLQAPGGAANTEAPLTVDWMKRAADDGLPEAQFEMALRHALGKGAPLDPVAARAWYARAAEQQYAPALCNLATMELQGSGGGVDLRRAEEHFRAAADAGFAQGNFGTGEALRLQNRLAEAADPYGRAAECGIVEADFWLGCIYREGVGRARDEREAAAHFLKAALGGHQIAQAVTADVLRRGAGVPADPGAAAHWDAEIGRFTNAEVLATIGSLYLEGRLVQRDPAKALHFFRNAAERGQPNAQRLAGTLLATGEAGERNLEEAYQWLWLAARGGQTEAEPAFQAVLRSMDGRQIIQAAQRASNFHPRTQ